MREPEVIKPELMQHRGMEIIVENIARFARGESLVNRVNLAGSE